MKKQLKQDQNGVALVTLLIFAVMAMTIFAASVILMVENSRSTTELSNAERAFYSADSGGEEAVLRYLRDRSYSGGTISVGDISSTVSLTDTGTITITSLGSYEDYIRALEITGALSDDAFGITNWKETN